MKKDKKKKKKKKSSIPNLRCMALRSDGQNNAKFVGQLDSYISQDIFMSPPLLERKKERRKKKKKENDFTYHLFPQNSARLAAFQGSTKLF